MLDVVNNLHACHVGWSDAGGPCRTRRRIHCIIVLILGLFAALGSHWQAVAAEPDLERPGYEFRMTKGAGVPVCAAYLKRLQATSFEHPPYCGRPENDSVPGFALLHRVPLSAEEILALYDRVQGFMLHGNQNWQEHEADRMRGLGIKAPVAKISVADIKVSISAGWLKAWRYDPAVDVENDGSLDNLVLWLGQGTGSEIGVCGTVPSNLPSPVRLSQIGLLLTLAGDSIDTDKTLNIFAHPFPYSAANVPSRRERPRMIGPQLGIFEYQGTYYLDTFLDGFGDFNNKRIGREDLVDTLAVFRRTKGKTDELCEYRMTEVPKKSGVTP